MKPIHEEELRTERGPGGRVYIIASDGRALAETRAEDGQEIAARFMALPDALRALLAHGRLGVEANGELPVWHTFACWERNMAVCTADCERDGAALSKAGVL